MLTRPRTKAPVLRAGHKTPLGDANRFYKVPDLNRADVRVPPHPEATARHKREILMLWITIRQACAGAP